MKLQHIAGRAGSHKSRQRQSLSARPVPIVLAGREEAIGVSHARIRAAQNELALGQTCQFPGFGQFPEAISSGRSNLCRRDWYQSSWLAERKRLVYHTPGSERRSETFPFT
ncbi:hypothetical protein DdX_22294 [Ditylenchus destructor]|uniref:Uncharacterized protein n=1 Tax=Ditylenchus destructor TaxID=166010 RepID=A0AAD4QSK8_9BILA|nr:hypothetical protein DdX_22294 [Ditylenchus destructor]